jgi:hypothetical protein
MGSVALGHVRGRDTGPGFGRFIENDAGLSGRCFFDSAQLSFVSRVLGYLGRTIIVNGGASAASPRRGLPPKSGRAGVPALNA